MARVVPQITAFNSGEWSPVLHGRTDLDKYARACREMINFLPTAQGAAVRRPGTRFAANSKNNGVVRLIPFEFSTLQAYVIEAGDQYFRFYRNGGRLESPPGTPIEVVTPYLLADLPQLQWAQSADTIYFAHPNYAPRKLTRTTPTSFTLTTVSFTATPTEWTGTNYPAAVTFWQGRLWWGGTPAQPQTIWGSKSADFENLTTGTSADSAVKFTLDADTMNAIRWLKAQRTLVVGTAGGEFQVSGGGVGDPVTPSNVLAVPTPSSVGSAPVGAVVLGSLLAFVQRAGRKVQSLALDEVAQGTTYAAQDMTILAGHLTRAGVKEMAWQQEPWRVLWCVLADGGLVGCTVMKDEGVLAWHRTVIGGTGVAVESAAVIPASGYSELWLSVKRTVAGFTVRHIERMTEDFVQAGSVVQGDACFVDSSLTYSGVPATTFSGLGHLEGETVQVLADGATHPNRVVASGAITLQQAASKIQVGLPYTARLETLDLNEGAQDGTSISRTRSISQVGCIFYQTLGGRIGYRDPVTNAYTMEDIVYRTAPMPMDVAPTLFTGTRLVDFPSRWERAAHIVAEQVDPLPMTLVGLAPRMNTND